MGSGRRPRAGRGDSVRTFRITDTIASAAQLRQLGQTQPAVGDGAGGNTIQGYVTFVSGSVTNADGQLFSGDCSTRPGGQNEFVSRVP